jgi:ubiquinone/menaquinone biosynthesis C-methylase UbiE
MKGFLPDKDLIRKHCTPSDTYIREYYGTSLQDRLRTWVFKQRLLVVLNLISKRRIRVSKVLDDGSGPMFIAYSLIRDFNSHYTGVDLIPSSEMSKYAKIIKIATGKKIDMVKASAQALPFREGSFDTVMALDVMEHLPKPEDAMTEAKRVAKENIIISVPMENTIQKLSRLPILLTEGKLKDPTPEYHYVGSFKTYSDMEKNLLRLSIETEYAPLRRVKSFNFYVIHLSRV